MGIGITEDHWETLIGFSEFPDFSHGIDWIWEVPGFSYGIEFQKPLILVVALYMRMCKPEAGI